MNTHDTTSSTKACALMRATKSAAVMSDASATDTAVTGAAVMGAAASGAEVMGVTAVVGGEVLRR
jgi:hypothetical protein